MADILYNWNKDEYLSDAFFKDEKAASQKKSKFKPIIIKIFIITLVLTLIGEAVFYAVILPYNSIAVINVSGCLDISSIEVKKLAGIDNNTKWLSINSSEISRRLVSYPGISSATVEKKFPDKVSIKIVERKAVAVAFTEVNGKTVPMEIDGCGVVFRIGSPILQTNLPIVTGLTFKNPREGMQINEKLSQLFVQLDILQKKYPVLVNEISEIKIQPKKYGGYDLVIYPLKSRLSVITDKFLTDESLRYMMLILDVVKDINLEKDIIGIDLRGANAVYIKREAEYE
ncbi:cell division protein FtsQ/DivIB [Treponema putidum]|uniref:FtsQ-type POTRA domain-containing protein n=1 Tax=Treponema putidum TaxID=221027 RepID=A0AAE9MW02_9SPIR|nr:FtsQ-type POTRA domain-containing protein [Treponema putidum]AIN94921.1 cell division protein [Treponema putidum]TWI77082.1 cell division protein FtsQ [Treponema putidum]UTY28940.1 FtsQ-type POTRA domain-containing protein [Treponema putidum]UTY31355.1 FtsQ-type POTRA domain-containing protein [Treponema putidum]UTY33792.1 FtsQ-type POTRA domain-containing protein [Treponema putidum]